MSELYKLSLERKNAKTRFVTFEDGTHNDTVLQHGYFDEFVKFLKEYVSDTN